MFYFLKKLYPKNILYFGMTLDLKYCHTSSLSDNFLEKKNHSALSNPKRKNKIISGIFSKNFSQPRTDSATWLLI